MILITLGRCVKNYPIIKRSTHIKLNEKKRFGNALAHLLLNAFTIPETKIPKNNKNAIYLAFSSYITDRIPESNR
jgi:hypothetical protein